MPATVLTWSATVVAAVLAISEEDTVAIEAGASSAFSWRREAVITMGLRTRACERMVIITSVLSPAPTLTPSTRVVSLPMNVTTTEWVPGATASVNRPASFVPCGPPCPSASTAAPERGSPVSASVT